MNLDKQQQTRLAIALGGVVALVLGFAVLNNSDSSSNASANTAMRGPGGQSGQLPPGGQGGPPKMEAVTGSAATRAKAAAEAKVDGSAQQVMKNPRGSGYVVFMKTDDDTPTIVEVSTGFKVTETHEMGAGPPQGRQPKAMQGTSAQ